MAVSVQHSKKSRNAKRCKNTALVPNGFVCSTAEMTIGSTQGIPVKPPHCRTVSDQASGLCQEFVQKLADPTWQLTEVSRVGENVMIHECVVLNVMETKKTVILKILEQE